MTDYRNQTYQKSTGNKKHKVTQAYHKRKMTDIKGDNSNG